MRGKPAPKRKITPDRKYNSELVGRFISFVMERGKKSVAESIVYDMIDWVGEKSKQDGLAVFERAIYNVAPMVEVKAKRVGGSNLQVPMEVKGRRKNALAFRWILEAAKSLTGPAYERIGKVILDSYNGEGAAMKKREDVHKMAEANRAFARFARRR